MTQDYSLVSEILQTFTSGAWQRATFMTDYRSELLDDLLVERASWDQSAPERHLGGKLIAAPGFVWFRFWFAEGEQLIEKYFDTQRKSIGYCMPISTTWRRRDTHWSATNLHLALWLDVQGHMTVLNEDHFEQLVGTEDLTESEIEHAEQRLRRLTLSIAQKRFPPPLVRNFAI